MQFKKKNGPARTIEPIVSNVLSKIYVILIVFTIPNRISNKLRLLIVAVPRIFNINQLK